MKDLTEMKAEAVAEKDDIKEVLIETLELLRQIEINTRKV